MTPRTKAGRRLLDLIQMSSYSEIESGVKSAILAIEAEASAEPGALREALDWRELAEILALPTVRRKLEARAFGHAAIAICAALSREEATSE